MSDEITVEVVYASPERQRLVSLSLSPNACVADAIEKSAMASHFPDDDLGACKVGIWGRIATRDDLLRSGDRVEIYRPLAMDPREARRRLAAAGKTMSDAAKG